MGRYSGKTCRLIFMLVLTVIFFVAEIVAGYMGNSIALVSDSFNMLSDILSLCVGLTASWVSRRAGSGRSTYGWVRAEVVGALANAVFLAALCFSVSVEAMKRLARPEAIDDPKLVLVVGALGLAVNIVGLLIFQDCRSCCCLGSRMKRAHESTKSDGGCEMNGEAGTTVLTDESELPQKEGQPLNIRGVLLHVLNDALGSVVVVVASALFYVWPLDPGAKCNWQCYVDPSLTLIMVVIIMSSAAPLLKETTTMLLQMCPADLPLAALVDEVCLLPGVLGIHDVHVWELCKGRLVATLHVHCSPELQGGVAAFTSLSRQIRQIFHQAGVHSLTLQPEFGEPSREGAPGAATCLEPSCQKLSCCPHATRQQTAVSQSNGHPLLPLTEVSVDEPDSTSTSTLLRERAGASKTVQSTEF
ncbi:LOW QUALITY PROTEIN: zinc transporter 10 [Alosa alosa]|uniref:LOW QUALITY PROTEIN: zinc transporter 10 n=1 Tax=Alosa alosa TaxID=278164 RepID=UPI002015434A|nr:LOW QUALITY PROTEIN: zinc transporter 10 [Alosa alosa]